MFDVEVAYAHMHRIKLPERLAGLRTVEDNGKNEVRLSIDKR